MKTGKLLALTVALLAIAGPLSACVPRITRTGPPTVPTPSSTILAPPPAATPTLERAGDDVVFLTWHREGGIAGFCDDLVVYADGQVAISLCKDSQPKAPKSLSSEQMEQLRRWVETYQSFEFEQRDEAVADGIAIRMAFAGNGSQEATEVDKQAMLAFAAALASSAPVPTATPEPTDTPPATATVAPTTTSTPTALPLSRTIPSEELANGIPVVVGQRLSREEDIGHFRVVRGYDDMTREFILGDPLFGPNLRIPYSTFSWLSNPGRVVPVYPAEMDPLVRSLVKGLRMREAPA